ncbi:MAG: wax ester/triacylglycerol synthase family O-acyltransferase [Candidatus Binatia bacterium]|nr:wax ester/triacylglycerol synthase family O-acyltransferase [Candidatus Binatia bacterium]
MAREFYERLSAMDRFFLEIEDRNVHMHVGAAAIFEGGMLLGSDGALDFPRILRLAERVVAEVPRLRQKIHIVPGFDHPVWQDDNRFNIHYHVRHTALPHPGDERQLKRLVGRILSQQLDRGKPLWEMWFVEGLSGKRFAAVSKVHHCMIDGLAGVSLMERLLSPEARAEAGAPKPWRPRPVPPDWKLLLDEASYRLGLMEEALGALRSAARHPLETLRRGVRLAGGIAEALARGFQPATLTPLNRPIGPHRRFDWTRLDLGQVRAIGQRLGATVNDVALTLTAGAVRMLLQRRGVDVGVVRFRTLVPVSVRAEQEKGALGNRVSLLVIDLPVSESDPVRRLQRVHQETSRLKASAQAQGAAALEALSDRTVTSLFVTFARLAATTHSYNMIVTNVPGPQRPLYLLGSRMREIYPVVPLFADQALNVALMSYDGGLFWGFNADWDSLPDLHDLVDAIEREHRALLARVGRRTASTRATSKRGATLPPRATVPRQAPAK